MLFCNSNYYQSSIAIMLDLGILRYTFEYAHKTGELREVFGTGTAATISLIKELCYKEHSLHFDINGWEVAPGIKDKLAAIREGRIADTHGWMVPVV